MNHRQYRAYAAALVRSNKYQPVLLSAVYFALTYLMTYFAGSLSGYLEYSGRVLNAYASFVRTGELIPPSYPEVTAYAAAGAVVIMLLLQLLSAGFSLSCALISRGEKVSVRDLALGFEYIRYIPLQIIRWLPFAASFVLFFFAAFIPNTALYLVAEFGCAILVTLALIFALYDTRFALYLMLDNNKMGIFKAMSQSRKLAKGRRSLMFRLDFSFLGWYAASYLLTSVGIIPVTDIWMQPSRELAMLGIYNQLTGHLPPPQPQPQQV